MTPLKIGKHAAASDICNTSGGAQCGQQNAGSRRLHEILHYMVQGSQLPLHKVQLYLCAVCGTVCRKGPPCNLKI